MFLSIEKVSNKLYNASVANNIGLFSHISALFTCLYNVALGKLEIYRNSRVTI
jgi:hypothetical protein